MTVHTDFATAPFLETPQHPNTAPQVIWARCEDGVRVRLANFGARPGGTVLCFPGRTEYVEKYVHVADAFLQADIGFVAIDWRGQGLADRLITDTALGHVDRFVDYQHDVRAMLAFAEAEHLPKPWYLVAHSMGGAIGLRALAEGLPVEKAAFSAPMWDLTITPPLKSLARFLTWASENTGMAHVMVPGSGRVPYVLSASPEDNRLTTDPDSFLWFQGHVKDTPGLGLSGPTMRWLYESFKEFHAFDQMPAPDIPCRAYLGTQERIVSPQAITRLADRWPSLSLVHVDGAEHEVLMEAPERRGEVLTDMIGFFQNA